MKKRYISFISSLFVISTWAVAEEAELLDAYLEDLPSSSVTSSTGATYQANESLIVGQPVEIVVDENGVSREVVQPQTVQYRRIQSADGSEVYEAVPITGAASPEPVVANDSGILMANEVEAHSTEDLEIIELEPVEIEYVEIEAPDTQTSQQVATSNATTHGVASSPQAFCGQNPYARECLLSKYLVLCKKDPQSSDCKSELRKFDRFCGTFPNAYKCKKAQIAASCKQNPEASACKTFGQRYCQKYPKAIFCNYN